MSQACYCGSKKSFSQCCEPFIKNHNAPNPEKLMRSRYSAFATSNAAYILESQVETLSIGVNEKSFKDELQGQQWVSLEILSAKEDYVVFKACMLYNGILYTMQEKSQFILKDKQWFYAKALEHKSHERVIKRNESCPCGSNKKYKQCCLTKA